MQALGAALKWEGQLLEAARKYGVSLWGWWLLVEAKVRRQSLPAYSFVSALGIMTLAHNSQYLSFLFYPHHRNPPLTIFR